MPKIAITKVFTSCNAAHAIAIDKSNQAYGWGRNEGLVLGSSFGENATVVPTPQIIAYDVAMAGLGKSHTIFLKTDGTLHGLGQNKSGQCGWRESVKQSGVLKPCNVLAGTKEDDASERTFVKVSCGEDFSLAIDQEGNLFSTGSSEYGQLGNGYVCFLG
jgi:alpha-tubulin suppressor-like RCC1 family protein